MMFNGIYPPVGLVIDLINWRNPFARQLNKPDQFNDSASDKSSEVDARGRSQTPDSRKRAHSPPPIANQTRRKLLRPMTQAEVEDVQVIRTPTKPVAFAPVKKRNDVMDQSQKD